MDNIPATTTRLILLLTYSALWLSSLADRGLAPTAPSIDRNERNPDPPRPTRPRPRRQHHRRPHRPGGFALRLGFGACRMSAVAGRGATARAPPASRAGTASDALGAPSLGPRLRVRPWHTAYSVAPGGPRARTGAARGHPVSGASRGTTWRPVVSLGPAPRPRLSRRPTAASCARPGTAAPPPSTATSLCSRPRTRGR